MPPLLLLLPPPRRRCTRRLLKHQLLSPSPRSHGIGDHKRRADNSGELTLPLAASRTVLLLDFCRSCHHAL